VFSEPYSQAAASRLPAGRGPARDMTTQDRRPRQRPYLFMGNGRGIDVRAAGESWERRREIGKSLRAQAPRESHAEWRAPAIRPDPIGAIERTNRSRQRELVPLRMGRMAGSPFAFLRGAIVVMAWDLSRSPVSTLDVIVNGDPHLSNFGLFATPWREIVFDFKNFDEATVGPWEWDLKRLVASINVAGRDNGLNRRERAEAVLDCVAAYRANLRQLQDMGVVDVWYFHAYPGERSPLVEAGPKAEAIFGGAIENARGQTNTALLTRIAERTADGAWRLRADPPALTRIDHAARERIIEGLNAYAHSLSLERRYLLSRYHLADVVQRVPDINGVGLRCYLALLFGNGDDDPLFLEIKEAIAPAFAPYLPALPDTLKHQGTRIVIAQRALQVAVDIMLGWTTIDGRPYYVRQVKSMGELPPEWLRGEAFRYYSRACGAILARAHARTGDAAGIAGYCGDSDVLDQALAAWAESYGDQTESDHAMLLRAIKSGRIPATTKV
jgi:uncharacterized protein (DUF2252 family)